MIAHLEVRTLLGEVPNAQDQCVVLIFIDIIYFRMIRNEDLCLILSKYFRESPVEMGSERMYICSGVNLLFALRQEKSRKKHKKKI